MEAPYENPFGSSDGSPASLSQPLIQEPPSPSWNSTSAAPATTPTPPQQTQPTTARSDFCCKLDEWIHSGDDAEILITDAQKVSISPVKSYIVYVIEAGTSVSYHRHSEFESLRASLVTLYPTLVIPPIPPKQSVADFVFKARDDPTLVAQRTRMLQTFLNRVARHPIISNEHVFHRFLTELDWWSNVLQSPPLSLLPKNILKTPPQNPTDPNVSPAYAALPSPSAAYPLRNPDQRFLDSEVFTNTFANHVSGPMEQVTRRTLKRALEHAQDHSHLGAALNGFSLSETGHLSAAIEKTGQAADTTYISTTRLVQELEQDWAELLLEYSQFASSIKKGLVYRHQKHVQYEMVQDALKAKRQELDGLEKSERESCRLQEALSTLSSPPHSEGSRAPATGLDQGTAGDARMGARSTDGDNQVDESASAYLLPHPGPSPSRRSVPGMGLLSALSYTLQVMMDIDPEMARRNEISKSRETILQLEDVLHLSAHDLKYVSSTMQADLNRYQVQKTADLLDMAVRMATSHRDWCQKNLAAWEEAKKEIATIPDHPHQLPPSEQPDAAAGAGSEPSSARRDSTATINATGRHDEI
ncbi:hypothetical protein PLICRDRAFT_115010 [Plicaturopsis crispa FD-325 SS-3]|nr:hypothetical protein PLICRDRAFT_115010 [Plicaturopsis crispa FD-325 SS-3]